MAYLGACHRMKIILNDSSHRRKHLSIDHNNEKKSPRIVDRELTSY